MLLRLPANPVDRAERVLLCVIAAEVLVVLGWSAWQRSTAGVVFYLVIFAWDLWPARLGAILLNRFPRSPAATVSGLGMYLIAAASWPLSLLAVYLSARDPLTIIMFLLVPVALWICGGALIAVTLGVMLARSRRPASHAG